MLIALPLMLVLWVPPAGLNVNADAVLLTLRYGVPSAIVAAAALVALLVYGLIRRLVPARPKLRLLLTALVALAGVAVVSAAIIVPDALNTLRRAQSGIENLGQMRDGLEDLSSLSPDDFDQLQVNLDRLAADLDHAGSYTRFVEGVAPINNDLEVALVTFNAGHRLVLGADHLLAGLRPVVATVGQSGQSAAETAALPSLNNLTEVLRDSQTRFRDADRYFDQARVDLEQLQDLPEPTDLLPFELPPSAELMSYRQQLQEITRLLIEAPDLLTIALGFDQPRGYLVLSQNNDELRPSGGYIGTYGWIGLQEGEITEFGYGATTPQSPNPPSRELESELEIPEWWMRFSQPIYAAWDGSWHADFRDTAEMAKWFYDLGENPLSPVDGVIAIDVMGFEYLMRALGSIDVPGYDITVTADNFREVIYDFRTVGIERDEAGREAHKAFLAALYPEIFYKLETLRENAGQEQLIEVLYAVNRALREKHILLYFVDQQLNDFADSMGWTGRQFPAVDHDYLMVVDANMTNKSNRSIVREIDLQVGIQPDGSLRNTLIVDYAYPASLAEHDPALTILELVSNPPTRDYHNLYQMFVPAGSDLTRSRVQRVVTQVDDEAHTSFNSALLLPYDGSERLRFEYATPVLVSAEEGIQHYRLLVQKQAGTLGDSLTVRVTLPPGAALVEATSGYEQTTSEDGIISLDYDLRLLTDLWIEVDYTLEDA